MPVMVMVCLGSVRFYETARIHSIDFMVIHLAMIKKGNSAHHFWYID